MTYNTESEIGNPLGGNQKTEYIDKYRNKWINEGQYKISSSQIWYHKNIYCTWFNKITRTIISEVNSELLPIQNYQKKEIKEVKSDQFTKDVLTSPNLSSFV